jgi:porin
MKQGLVVCALAALGTTPFALADPSPEYIEARHGAVTMPDQPIAVEGGITAVLQVPDDKRIDAELVSSFDLVTTLPAGDGKWVIYVEGNTTPKTGGVSTMLGEANADAGSALDRDGKGRLQVSELHYFHPYADGLLVAGLVDVTASLDGSEVANDETSQFLNRALVNNPTIDFPDYSLGVVYNREASEGKGFSLALISSHGLADNPDASYAQLVDIGADGKGVFAAAEGQWPVAGTQLRAGVWINTADHLQLDGGADTAHNYGVYVVADGHLATGMWNLRAGLANDKVSQASHFLSAALERPMSKATLGLGIAYTGLSSKDTTPQQDDMLLAEGYLRFTPHQNISVTPSVQWLNNSGFDASGNTVDADQTLLSLRLNYTF